MEYQTFGQSGPVCPYPPVGSRYGRPVFPDPSPTETMCRSAGKTPRSGEGRLGLSVHPIPFVVRFYLFGSVYQWVAGVSWGGGRTLLSPGTRPSERKDSWLGWRPCDPEPSPVSKGPGGRRDVSTRPRQRRLQLDVEASCRSPHPCRPLPLNLFGSLIPA